jgi:hypothetical protein
VWQYVKKKATQIVAEKVGDEQRRRFNDWFEEECKTTVGGKIAQKNYIKCG